MSIWAAVILIFAVCALAFLMVLLTVVIRMRQEKYQIPYVETHLNREEDRMEDLSWKRYREAASSSYRS
jgi:hypothetical protein